MTPMIDKGADAVPWKVKKPGEKQSSGGNTRALERTNRKMATAEGEEAGDNHGVPEDDIQRGLAFITGAKPRPNGYTRDLDQFIYVRLCSKRVCWTLKALAACWGITDVTLYRWIEQNETLQYAIFQGRAVQEANFGSVLLNGFKYSTGVEYILMNLHNWTTKQKTEHAIDLNSAINQQESLAAPVDWTNLDEAPRAARLGDRAHDAKAIDVRARTEDVERDGPEPGEYDYSAAIEGE